MPVDNELRRRLNLPPEEDNQQQVDPPTPTGDEHPENPENPETPEQIQQRQEQERQQEHDQPQEIPADLLLASIQRFNPEIKSLDDLKPKPAPESEEQRRRKKERQMVAWALNNEKIEKETYDQYQQDRAKNPRQIVYENFVQQRKAQNKAITPEQIDREFKKFYHEEPLADDEDAETLQGMASEQMKAEAKRILKRNYPAIFKLEKEYDNHVSEQNTKAQNVEKAKTFVQTFTRDIEDIAKKTTSRVYKIGDQEHGEAEEVPFEFAPEVINKVKKDFLSNNGMTPFIANYSREVLEGAFMLQLLVETEDQRIATVARRYAAKLRKLNKSGRNEMRVDDLGVSSTTEEEFQDTDLRRRLNMPAPSKQ